MKENPGRFYFSIATLLSVLLVTPFAQGRGKNEELKFALRQDLLARINRDRAAHGLRPVQLDPHASEIADRYCEQQIGNRTTGHFTTDGLPPYMRYSLAGGDHGVSENAAAWSANYNFSDAAVSELVRTSQDAMMAERPPHDGHRRTILDEHATHVGIGLAWHGGEFRLAQEFVRRYVEWSDPLPRSASVARPATATGQVHAGYKVEAMSVHFEPHPLPMDPRVASRIESYSLPKTRRDYVATATGTPIRRTALRRASQTSPLRQESDGSFAFEVPFTEGPGTYTVVLWVKKNGTAERIAASNVSIRAHAPQPPVAAYTPAGR